MANDKIIVVTNKPKERIAVKTSLLPAASVDELISAFSLAIDLAEGLHLNHARRTAYISLRLAGALGLPEESCREIYYAGLLHDAGAIKLPFPLAHLNQATSTDNQIITAHPEKGAEIIRNLPFGEPAGEIILSHHEAWDGSGYPRGLKGEGIPPGSRILCLADKVDLAYQAYPGSGPGSTFLVDLVRRNAGKLFDPDLAGRFASMADGEFWSELRGISREDAPLSALWPKGLPATHPPDGGSTGMSSGSARRDSVDPGNVVRALAELIDAKSPYTASHSSNVARLSEMVAEKFGFYTADREAIRVAGFLHDIGKVAIPGAILDKPGRLDPQEMEVMRKHSLYSGQILSRIRPFARDVAIWAQSHHERLDGTGYPSGLRGVNVHLQARILSAADMFDALTSDRSYRKGMPPAEAVELMARTADDTFGRDVLEATVDSVVMKNP